MKVKEFVRRLKTYRYKSTIFHFTDAANIPTIREHGLLSKLQQDEIGLAPPNPGGDTISRNTDKIRKIYDDVSLCFTQFNPMAMKCHIDGRHSDQFYLCIDPEILRVEGVRIALGMANQHSTRILPIAEALEEMDTEILTSWVDPPESKSRLTIANKLEILVPKRVPVNMILDKKPANYRAK